MVLLADWRLGGGVDLDEAQVVTGHLRGGVPAGEAAVDEALERPLKGA